MLSRFGQAFRKISSRLLVQEEHGFQRVHNVPPWPQELKKKPDLVRVKPSVNNFLAVPRIYFGADWSA